MNTKSDLERMTTKHNGLTRIGTKSWIYGALHVFEDPIHGDEAPLLVFDEHGIQLPNHDYETLDIGGLHWHEHFDPEELAQYRQKVVSSTDITCAMISEISPLGGFSVTFPSRNGVDALSVRIVPDTFPSEKLKGLTEPELIDLEVAVQGECMLMSKMVALAPQMTSFVLAVANGELKDPAKIRAQAEILFSSMTLMKDIGPVRLPETVK